MRELLLPGFVPPSEFVMDPDKTYIHLISPTVNCQHIIRIPTVFQLQPHTTMVIGVCPTPVKNWHRSINETVIEEFPEYHRMIFNHQDHPYFIYRENLRELQESLRQALPSVDTMDLIRLLL
jgi:hypothetical protein